MANHTLYIRLLSDTSFGRGDGIGGVVNSEVEHNSRTGLPYIKGRTLKGLLVEACADLLYGIEKSNHPYFRDIVNIARNLFGIPGSTHEDKGVIQVGNGILPHGFQQRVKASIHAGSYTSTEILEAMTTVRYQTAVDALTDKPLDTSLRATRVIVRNTIFEAKILSDKGLNNDQLAYLCACVGTVRRAGLNRSRGLGHIKMYVDSEETQRDAIAYFANSMQEGVR